MVDSRADEARLVNAARDGQVDAFNTLVLAYQSAIYNLAYRLTGDTAMAADATQEAFIAAFRHLPQFRDGHDGSFRAWLYRIATNVCYDELRRLKRRPSVSLDQPEIEARLASPGEPPEVAAQRTELNRAIQDCLDALPDDQRTAVILCDVQEFDYQQIAIITAQALGTVKSRINRARGRLRECLSLEAVRELLPDSYRPNKQAPLKS